MTREEAREILTHNWTRVDNPNYSESELDEAFFMAIEALQADRPTHDRDLISRHEALVELNGACEMWEDDAIVADIIHKLPSIEIVRCKDCRYLFRKDFCSFFGSPINTMDYCSYAERREP